MGPSQGLQAAFAFLGGIFSGGECWPLGARWGKKRGMTDAVAKQAGADAWWMEAPEAVVDRALALGQLDTAIDAMGPLGLGREARRHEAWLKGLPPTAVAARPALHVLYGLLAAMQGDGVEAAARFAAATESGALGQDVAWAVRAEAAALAPESVDAAERDALAEVPKGQAPWARARALEVAAMALEAGGQPAGAEQVLNSLLAMPHFGASAVAGCQRRAALALGAAAWKRGAWDVAETAFGRALAVAEGGPDGGTEAVAEAGQARWGMAALARREGRNEEGDRLATAAAGCDPEGVADATGRARGRLLEAWARAAGQDGPGAARAAAAGLAELRRAGRGGHPLAAALAAVQNAPSAQPSAMVGSPAPSLSAPKLSLAPVGASPLVLRCFGPFEVEVGGKLVDKWPRRRARAFLALLAVRTAGLTQAQLADRLFPHLDADGARHQLSNLASFVRTMLKPVEPGATLAFRPPYYRLEGATSDWVAAHNALAEAEAAVGSGDAVAGAAAALRLVAAAGGRPVLPDDDLQEALEPERAAFMDRLGRLARRLGGANALDADLAAGLEALEGYD